ERIGAIGAGTMGNGIAQVCAAAGLSVTMIDIAPEAVQRGLETITSSLDRLVKKEKLSAADKDGILARIRGTTRYDELGPVDLVIEAATENMELKKLILPQIDQQVSETAIIATNTSSLSVTELAAVVSRPER